MKLQKDLNKYSIGAFILGITGMVVWAFSMAAVIINIGTLYFGVIGLESRYRDLSVAAIIMGILGFLIAIIRNIIVWIY